NERRRPRQTRSAARVRTGRRGLRAIQSPGPVGPKMWISVDLHRLGCRLVDSGQPIPGSLGRLTPSGYSASSHEVVMQLRGRRLQAGMAGADVAELHHELIRLGYTIPEFEQEHEIFGVGTAAAVAHFQKAHDLWDTAIVEAHTAASLTRALQAGA